MRTRQLKTPVLLILFNRPDFTAQVLSVLQRVKPKQLYIAIDGPRVGNSSDTRLCQEVRGLLQTVRWRCTIKTRIRTRNLGCKYGPVDAMNWFFSHVEEGIICEDDILPDESFFYFCQELLRKYRYDKRVGQISGGNITPIASSGASYFFSKYSQTWGWATWRRVWRHYDSELKKWPTYKKEKLLSNIFSDRLAILYWNLIFDAVYKHELNTVWDYQWTCMSWTYNYVSIIPSHNLVRNVGIGAKDATHTKMKNKYIHCSYYSMQFPLVHPKKIATNEEFDAYIQKHHYVLWKEIVMIIIRKWSKIFS